MVRHDVESARGLRRLSAAAGANRGPEVHHAGLVYSVGITPTNAAASLAAIRSVRGGPDRLRRLHALSELFWPAAEADLDTGDSRTPMIPWIVGDSERP